MGALQNGFTRLPGVAIGPNGSIFADVRVYTFTLTDATTVGANATAERTYTVTGLLADDVVLSANWVPTANLVIGGLRVSAANTLAIQWGNVTAGATAPSAGGKAMTIVVANVYAN